MRNKPGLSGPTPHFERAQMSFGSSELASTAARGRPHPDRTFRPDDILRSVMCPSAVTSARRRAVTGCCPAGDMQVAGVISSHPTPHPRPSSGGHQPLTSPSLSVNVSRYAETSISLSPSIFRGKLVIVGLKQVLHNPSFRKYLHICSKYLPCCPNKYSIYVTSHVR